MYVACFFVGLTLLDLLIVSPVFSKIQSLNEEIKEREAAIKRNMSIVSQRDRIVAENARYAAYRDNARSEEEEITALLKEVESLANSSSVYLADMKPATRKGSGGSKKIIISVECEVQMEQIVNFMYALENSQKLLTGEKYEMTPKTKDSSVAKCSLTLIKTTL
jgi:hypothetical protein